MVPENAFIVIWGLLEMSYWWNYNCAQRIQIWQAGLLWVYVALEREWHWVVLSVWWFSSAQFFFLLPFVINDDIVRSTTKKSLSTLSLRQPSMIIWCWQGSTMQVVPTLRTWLEYVWMPWAISSKHAFLLVSRIRPGVSADTFCDHMESFEIIKLLRRKGLINFKK